MAKYAYYVDLSICAGCEACTVACQNKNGLAYDMRYTKVERLMVGTFPDLKSSFITTQCMHCDEPPCAQVCPTGATYKSSEGPVIVGDEKCIGCQYCMTACPYDARSFDEAEHVAKKCTFCFDRLAKGEKPACVQTCLTGARQIGDLENPEDPIHKAIAAQDVFQVGGTSFYYKLPAGIDRSAVPANFETSSITWAWQSIFQPAGQILMGSTVGAILISLAANALKSMRKEGNEHGDH
ncbi:MAG: 4Fe-4S dicluster domain-containing protein [Bacillota bacterium]